MPVALITGASKGLGRALARGLAADGWSLVLDARGADALMATAQGLSGATAIPGDVSEDSHRAALADAVRRMGSLDLLVNNASYLGPSPLPRLAEYPLDELARVYEVDVIAPLALTQRLLPLLSERGVVVNITSDASVEPYEGWGGYGSAKAALDHLTAIFAAEHPDLAVYAVDPGDMQTDMHQAAFPGEDISDRPVPEMVVPALLRLLDERPPSGRYRASDFAPVGVSE
jgi:NAD(P)-dependent dehydrogenase (short-subunit alcohol dehydrogenase family)